MKLYRKSTKKGSDVRDLESATSRVLGRSGIREIKALKKASAEKTI